MHTNADMKFVSGSRNLECIKNAGYFGFSTLARNLFSIMWGEGVVRSIITTCQYFSEQLIHS